MPMPSFLDDGNIEYDFNSTTSTITLVNFDKTIEVLFPNLALKQAGCKKVVIEEIEGGYTIKKG